VRGKGYVVPSEAELAICLPSALLVSQSGQSTQVPVIEVN